MHTRVLTQTHWHLPSRSLPTTCLECAGAQFVDHDITDLPLTNELFNIPIPIVRQHILSRAYH